MHALAGADMPSDPTERSFAVVEQAARDRLAAVLQPLPWIDGLMTALAIAMDASGKVLGIVQCIDHVWNENEAEIDKLTEAETSEISARLMGHYSHVVTGMLDHEAYRPYLAGYGDPLEGAAHWAAGFCTGLSAQGEAWAPLLAEEDARSLVGAIFCLVRDEDMPEDLRAESPFRDMPPDRREHMRRSTLKMLPQIVLSLHNHALSLGEDDDLDLDGDDDLDEEGFTSSQETYARAVPKVGRNDPCPCGSGKKHKRCCLE